MCSGLREMCGKSLNFVVRRNSNIWLLFNSVLLLLGLSSFRVFILIISLALASLALCLTSESCARTKMDLFIKYYLKIFA